MNTSEEIVCCQLQTPCFSENKNTKKSHKIPENAVSDTLLMSGFQIFAADAALYISRSARFFFAPNQEKCPIIPRFLPESLVLGSDGESSKYEICPARCHAPEYKHLCMCVTDG